MDLPTLLPSELDFLSTVGREEEIMPALLHRQAVEELVLFFEAASEDESWCERHPEVIKNILSWLTIEFASHRLPLGYAERVVQAFHLHQRVLKRQLPADLELDVRGNIFRVNSLLFGQASPYLRELIELNYSPGTLTRINLGDVRLAPFKAVEEFIQTGVVRDLNVASKEELSAIFMLTVQWGIVGLRTRSLRLFRHYIDFNACPDLLALAQRHQLSDIREMACELWNAAVVGSRLESEGAGGLALIVSEWRDRDVPQLFAVAQWVTRLAFRGKSVSDTRAQEVLVQCRSLESLDVSETDACELSFFEAAPPAIDLRLAACGWLDDSGLLYLVYRFPALRKLDLSGNTQLTIKAWMSFGTRRGLESLKLAHCHQIKDKELDIIVGLYGLDLLELDISWCTALTDEGVRSIVNSCPRLSTLNLSHCSQLTDRSLLHLERRKPPLHKLSVSGCLNISDDGVLELVNHMQLTTLDLSFCHVSEETLVEIRRSQPHLELIG